MIILLELENLLNCGIDRRPGGYFERLLRSTGRHVEHTKFPVAVLSNKVLQVLDFGLRICALPHNLDRYLLVSAECDRVRPISVHERRQNRRRRMHENFESFSLESRQDTFEYVKFGGLRGTHLGKILERVI